MNPTEQASAIQAAWDVRARENAPPLHRQLQSEWTDEDFFGSGEATVQGHILTDVQNIYQGKDPRDMRVLEIGCGAGRITRALANLFGEVHAVDISGEMIARARESLQNHPSTPLSRPTGEQWASISSPIPLTCPSISPSRSTSSSTFRATRSLRAISVKLSRLLRPGALFKFQAQGSLLVEVKPRGNLGRRTYLRRNAPTELAARHNFELRYSAGAGEEEFWLWFFKK